MYTMSYVLYVHTGGGHLRHQLWGIYWMSYTMISTQHISTYICVYNAIYVLYVHKGRGAFTWSVMGYLLNELCNNIKTTYLSLHICIQFHMYCKGGHLRDQLWGIYWISKQSPNTNKTPTQTRTNEKEKTKLAIAFVHLLSLKRKPTAGSRSGELYSLYLYFVVVY